MHFRELAERLRSACAEQTVWHDGKPVKMTVSIGVAEYSAADFSVEDVMGRADGALYRAKSAGRNRIELA